MNILIADDHELVRRGLRSLLGDEYPDAYIREAGSASDALEMAGVVTYHLAIVDINLPGRDGLDLLGDLRRLYPALPVLMVSAHTEEEFAIRALKLGAAGYVSKQSAADVLVSAVKKVLAGGRYISAIVAERLARAVAEGWDGEPHEALSHRELQVLKRIAEGRSIKEIAAELALSEKTIATYRSRISEKLQLAGNVELTRYAMKHGIIS
ncbi:response regulator transcription factor [Luteolibacter flavescens]|uniref:Response regulator transcription factor n=1 Tax=Luteolibacter flavescens TaxID=1859460 RepID=A0ABT3FQT4_9BACT|nr:response regulator transcription factor [Luteolibacter flavescens]MCW1885938.1 response regulator transcription factor [Luteolibacter flavescens]